MILSFLFLCQNVKICHDLYDKNSYSPLSIAILCYQQLFSSIDSFSLLSIAFLFYKSGKYIWITIKGWEYYPWKSAWIATNAVSRQNSLSLVTLLSMRSFAINDPCSPDHTLCPPPGFNWNNFIWLNSFTQPAFVMVVTNIRCGNHRHINSQQTCTNHICMYCTHKAFVRLSTYMTAQYEMFNGFQV